MLSRFALPPSTGASMGATIRFLGRLIRRFVTCVQGLLPGLYQGLIAVAGMDPESEHFKAAWCLRIEQKAFLATMAKSTGEAVTPDQQLSGLMAQTVRQTKMCGVRGQKVPGGLQHFADRQ